jgi:hypothetical protein
VPELNPNITAFQRNFDTFDTAAHGGGTDGIVSLEDVRAVANGSQYTAEQRQAAQYLLDHPDAFNQLDTGSQGGGLYVADGKISHGDVDAVVANAPLFADTSTFGSDSPNLPEARGFDDPREAATQTEFIARDSMGDSDASATGQFMSLVHAHKDDPQWLQAYFGALGAERTAHYLSNVADPNRYDGIGADFANDEIATVRGVLQDMYASGELNDADIGRLVEAWAMEGGDFNTGVAQLFGGLEGTKAEAMQNAFFRATTELSLAGQDLSAHDFTFSDDAIGRLSDGDRESLAAAGAYVLGRTSWDNRNARMIELQTDGGDGAVDRFITLAMANPTKVAGFDAYTSDAEQTRLIDPSSRPPVGQEVDYDGVADIVDSLSYDTTYRGGPDRYLPPAPYSFAAQQSVRDVVFSAAANGLDANPGQWEGNTTLKDGLSRILMDDFDRMVAEATAANGAGFDDEHPFPKALENFAQHVLFTDPTGGSRDATSQFLIDKLSTMINDVNTLSDADFAAKYDGSNQAQITHLAGAILGHIDNGLEQATQAASDKYEAEKKGLEFGLDLAWALGQDGLKLLPGGNVVSTILPDSVTGSETFGAIKGEIETMMREGLGDQAAGLLLEKFPDLHADGALSGLTQELSEVVSVGNERDFLSALLSSYEYVDSNPAAQ